MDENFLSDIKKSIQYFNDSLQKHIPAFEIEVNDLIEKKCSDTNKIENTLDTLLSLTNHGVGNDLFIKLLEYYKTINEEGALFYWNEYDGEVL